MSPTFEIQFEFEVFCQECGEGLCRLSDTDSKRGHYNLYICVCPKCKAKLETEIEDLKSRIEELEEGAQDAVGCTVGRQKTKDRAKNKGRERDRKRKNR